MTRPHADIATVEALLAAGGERIVEIASYAKTRVKARGLRAGSELSVVELAAMVIVLDLHRIDHPAVRPAAADARAGSAGAPAGAEGAGL